MATTLKLPFVRFVAQVNTAPAEPKANYQALAGRNALALQKCEWREAAKSAKATLVTHNFTVSHAGDQYDAYLMTGDYNAENSTEVAYAGIAAYRFTLPAAYLSGSQTLVSMSLPVTRDRFLLPGVRVVAVLSDSAQPSTSWATVRGESSPAASETEYLKNSATRITAALDDSGTLELDLAGTDTTKKPYLWIYLTVEDYAATWTMYSKTEPRLYAIEGSAMLVAEDATVTFSADVAQDSLFCYGKYDLSTGEFTKWFDLADDSASGVSEPGDLVLADGTSVNIVSVCGENVYSSLPILPGFAIYDVTNGRHIGFDAATRLFKRQDGQDVDVTEAVLRFFSRNGGVGSVLLYTSQSSAGDGIVDVSGEFWPKHAAFNVDVGYVNLRFRYNPSTGEVSQHEVSADFGLYCGLFPTVSNAMFSCSDFSVDGPIAYAKTGKAYCSFYSYSSDLTLDSGAITFINSTRGPRANPGYNAAYAYSTCIAGTFNKLGGVACNGLAVVLSGGNANFLVKPAYPLKLNFDNMDDLVFFSVYDSNQLFLSGSFKTINGVRVDGCAFVLPPKSSWLLDPSDQGYEEPVWNNVILPGRVERISKICNFKGIDYSTFPSMNVGSYVSCMRRN